MAKYLGDDSVQHFEFPAAAPNVVTQGQVLFWVQEQKRMVAHFSQLHHDIQQSFGLETVFLIRFQSPFVSDLFILVLLPGGKSNFDDEFLLLGDFRLDFLLDSSQQKRTQDLFYKST
jgi:hypothetical protein